jgi:hypothetical protein
VLLQLMYFANLQIFLKTCLNINNLNWFNVIIFCLFCPCICLIAVVGFFVMTAIGHWLFRHFVIIHRRKLQCRPQHWGGLQWHNIPIEFCENRPLA